MSMVYWQGGQPGYAMVAVPDVRPCSSGHVITAWIVTAVTLLYTLPWAIAATRGKANLDTIVLVNVLLGWTIVGWWIALVMSVLDHKVRLVPASQTPYGYPPRY